MLPKSFILCYKYESIKSTCSMHRCRYSHDRQVGFSEENLVFHSLCGWLKVKYKHIIIITPANCSAPHVMPNNWRRKTLLTECWHVVECCKINIRSKLQNVNIYWSYLNRYHKPDFNPIVGQPIDRKEIIIQQDYWKIIWMLAVSQSILGFPLLPQKTTIANIYYLI